MEELKTTIDETGDSSVQGLATEIGELPTDSQSDEIEAANNILKKVKESSSLVESGADLHTGSALLQEAYAEAHSNNHLTEVMSGKMGFFGWTYSALGLAGHCLSFVRWGSGPLGFRF